MGQFWETIPENISRWILQQKMFWVATAPLSETGHVNVSPKGGGSDYFGLLDNKTFWYLDLSGSGNETLSHLYENGRITVMFNAFEGPPRIVRLFGTGTVLENDTGSNNNQGRFVNENGSKFAQFVKKHDVKLLPGARAIIVVNVHQVGSSCGYSVPYYEFKDFRNTLNEFFRKKVEGYERGKDEDKMERYWAYKNAWSVDGMPGMKCALETADKERIAPLEKMVGPNAPRPGRYALRRYTAGDMVLCAMVAVLVSGLLQAFATLWFWHGTEGLVELFKVLIQDFLDWVKGFE